MYYSLAFALFVSTVQILHEDACTKEGLGMLLQPAVIYDYLAYIFYIIQGVS
jgi:hypothetical protein